MDINIRKATKEDYQNVMKLYGEFVGNPQRFIQNNNDSYMKVIEDPNSHLDVAIIVHEIVAFVMYTTRTVVRYPKPIIEVDELFISPDYRRRGIGRRLIEHILAFAKAHNYHYVFAASANERVAGHKLYEKLEFDKYGLHYRRKP